MPIAIAKDGSSPRVRGTDPASAGTAAAGRFIPACAGNSWRHRETTQRSAVHPRVCGEQFISTDSLPGPIGSSPRVRGTGQRRPRRSLALRFIPACAGNRRAPTPAVQWTTVHPRVCGEQIEGRHYDACTVGSSPRVRGTAASAHFLEREVRFIPACAGNRVGIVRRSYSRTVHPRVCGELGATGFSECGRCRFIPACAGNSPSLPCPVHPRVCGEQTGGSILPPYLNGSSPRVRGTGIQPRKSRMQPRFIPACAGNRRRLATSRLTSAVHPRVCGEQ